MNTVNEFGGNPVDLGLVDQHRVDRLVRGLRAVRHHHALVGRQRVAFGQPRGAWQEMEISVNTLIDDTVASGNKLDGIYIESAATGTTITDSFLGTNLGGTTAIGNGQSGLLVVNANATTITNVTASQNGLHGLFLAGGGLGELRRIVEADMDRARGIVNG